MSTYIAAILPRWGTAAAEETDRVESGGDLESFAMKNEMPHDMLLFIGSKLSATILNYNCYW
jgi:hypothetical protein